MTYLHSTVFLNSASLSLFSLFCKSSSHCQLRTIRVLSLKTLCSGSALLVLNGTSFNSELNILPTWDCTVLCHPELITCFFPLELETKLCLSCNFWFSYRFQCSCVSPLLTKANKSLKAYTVPHEFCVKCSIPQTCTAQSNEIIFHWTWNILRACIALGRVDLELCKLL